MGCLISTMDDKESKNSRWSKLHTDLLVLVLKKLCFQDIIRFKAVCSSWNKAAQSYISSPSYSLHQAPCLMRQTHHKDGSFPHTLFSFTEKKIYILRDDITRVDSESCIGSSHGWMMILRKSNIPVVVKNPFSLQRFKLPTVENLQITLYIDTAILLSDPFRSKNSNLSVVVVLYGGYKRLAFCNVAGEAWTQFFEARNGDEIVKSIQSHNGQLYVLSRDFCVQVWDFNHDPFPTKTRNLKPSPLLFIGHYPAYKYIRLAYLIESMGELLVVLRIVYYKLNHTKTVNFHVIKLDFKGEKWEKVENLQGRALLVGCPSISVSIKEFPEFEDNSIYFLDDNYNLSIGDMGVYNMGNKSIKPFDELDKLQETTSPKPSFWIVPNPW
ncbi:hypothetical protein UlMin_003098 [Ulmus minor]